MNNYQSIYITNTTTQIPSCPIADQQEPGALGAKDVALLDQGQTTRSNKNIPWKKITFAVVGLTGLGLGVYYGSALLPKLASGITPEPTDPKGKDYWTQVFANATAKADASCASADVPDSYGSFVKMADKFTVDFTQFPSVVGNAANKLRECHRP